MLKVSISQSFACVHKAKSILRHSDIFVTRVRHDTSTSNLVNHANRCDGTLDANQGSVEQFAHGSTYSKELLRVYVDLWTATSYRPFVIVDDPYFIKIIQMFNPKAELPSDSTISRDVKEFLQIGQDNLKAFIKVSKHIPHHC